MGGSVQLDQVRIAERLRAAARNRRQHAREMLGSQFGTPIGKEEDKSELQVVSITRKVTINEDLLPYPNEAILHKHFPGHTEEVQDCAIFANGTKVATTSIDGKIRIFKLDKADPIHVLDWDCRVITAIGQNMLAAFCKDTDLKTFTAYDRVVTEYSSLRVDTYGSSLVRLGDSGLALGNTFGDLLFYTHNKGRNLQYSAYIRAHDGGIHCMDARGEKLLTASTGSEATVWDWKAKERLETFTVEAEITTVAINERFIFIATMSNDLRVWYNEPNYRIRAHVKNLHIEQPVRALLPIGTDLLISADQVGDLIYTRLSTHKPVALEEVIAASKINAMAVTNDGSIVTVGCASENNAGFAAIVNPPKLVNTTIRAQAFRLYPKTSLDQFKIFSPEPEDLENLSATTRKKKPTMSTSTFSISSAIKKPDPQKSRRAQRRRRSILHDSMPTVSTSKAPTAQNPSSISEPSRVFSAYQPPYHVQKEVAKMSKVPRRSPRNNPEAGAGAAETSPQNSDGEANDVGENDAPFIEDMFVDLNPMQDGQPSPQPKNPVKNGTQMPQENDPSPKSMNTRNAPQADENSSPKSVNARNSPRVNENPSPQSANRPGKVEGTVQPEQERQFVTPTNVPGPPEGRAHPENVRYPRGRVSNADTAVEPNVPHELPFAAQMTHRPPLQQVRSNRARNSSRRRDEPAFERNHDRRNHRRSEPHRSEHPRQRERYSSRGRSPSPRSQCRRGRTPSPRNRPRRRRRLSPSPRRQERRRDRSPPPRRRRSYDDRPRRSSSREREHERRSRYRSRSPRRRHSSPYRSDYRRSRSPRRPHFSPVRREARIQWPVPRSSREAELLSQVEPLRFELRCILPPQLVDLGHGTRRDERDRRDSRDARDRRDPRNLRDNRNHR